MPGDAAPQRQRHATRPRTRRRDADGDAGERNPNANRDRATAGRTEPLNKVRTNAAPARRRKRNARRARWDLATGKELYTLLLLQ